MANTSFKTLALLGSLAIGSASVAVAQDSGPIIDKLVAKGLLTDQEGEDLRAEMLRDFGTTSAGKLDISSSVTKLKISGDARVRYQFDNELANPEAAAGDRDRNRYRYRVRIGLEAELGPKWTVATRLESASGATSTNADLGSATDNFDKTGDVVYFGQVYLNFKDTGILESESFDLRMGKLPHKFFNPGVNGFWIDSDINFEGAAQEIVYSDIVLKDSKLSTRLGQFILNNNAANSSAVSGAAVNTTVDPSLLLVGQVEYATKTWKVAPTIVAFAAPAEHDKNVNGAVNAASATALQTTNANQTSDTVVYNDLATVLIPFEYKLTFAPKPLALYATYGYNFSGEQRAKRLANSATVQKDALIYNAGVRYGENKLTGDYQLVAEYRHVGNGSYSSLLLDSDFNGGLLNGEGVILSGTYSFTAAVTSTITYFNSFNIENNRAAGSSRGNGFGNAQVLQIDLSAKF